jgi:hypothetical protein
VYRGELMPACGSVYRRVLPLHALRLRLPAARAFATAGRRQALPAAIPDVDQDLAEQEDDMEAPNSLSDEELEEGIEDGEDSDAVGDESAYVPTEFEDEEIDLAVNLEGSEEPKSQVPPEISTSLARCSRARHRCAHRLLASCPLPPVSPARRDRPRVASH